MFNFVKLVNMCHVMFFFPIVRGDVDKSMTPKDFIGQVAGSGLCHLSSVPVDTCKCQDDFKMLVHQIACTHVIKRRCLIYVVADGLRPNQKNSPVCFEFQSLLITPDAFTFIRYLLFEQISAKFCVDAVPLFKVSYSENHAKLSISLADHSLLAEDELRVLWWSNHFHIHNPDHCSINHNADGELNNQ